MQSVLGSQSAVLSSSTVNRQLETFFSRLQSHNQPGDNQVRDGQREQKLPSKSHKLVIAEAGQRATNPNVDKEKAENPQHEPEHRQNRLQPRRAEERSVPSAQEKQRGQAGHG